MTNFLDFWQGKPEMDKIVLIVDDELMTRNLLRLMLETAGFKVIEASDGFEAITKAKTEQPDLMILDVMMPDLDGYDVCRTLRHDEEMVDLPIIMLSAKPVSIAQRESLDAGADKFLSKPISRDALVACIKEVLTNAISMCPKL